MLDIKWIKENPEDVITRLHNKGKEAREEINRILELDARRRELIGKSEKLKAEQNKESKMIPQYKKEGRDVAPIFARLKELADTVKADEAELKTVEEEYNTLMLSLPNLPDRDLLPGGKENNVPLRYYGEPHRFDFTPKNHVELCTDLGLIDYERGQIGRASCRERV